MEKFATLIGFFNKQTPIIKGIWEEVIKLDLAVYEQQYVFALKTQQLYTAIEDTFKNIAKTFENNIENYSQYHAELLQKMNLEIPEIRPAVISDDTFKLLDKARRFRHFIRHAYHYDLDKDELELLQKKLSIGKHGLYNNLEKFYNFLQTLQKST